MNKYCSEDKDVNPFLPSFSLKFSLLSFLYSSKFSIPSQTTYQILLTPKPKIWIWGGGAEFIVSSFQTCHLPSQLPNPVTDAFTCHRQPYVLLLQIWGPKKFWSLTQKRKEGGRGPIQAFKLSTCLHRLLSQNPLLSSSPTNFHSNEPNPFLSELSLDAAAPRSNVRCRICHSC